MGETKEARTCQNCQTQFVIEPEDFNFYEKMKVPAPTWCWECRMRRRMLIRNERSLYRGTCKLCGKQTFSMYAPDSPYTVYCKECWYSDNWNFLEYGRDYDFSKPFFEQFRELVLKVPRIALLQIGNNTNTGYGNYIANGKNIYLSYSSVESENVFYSKSVDKSKECFDSFGVNDAEMIYENLDGQKNYRTAFTVSSSGCLESSFLYDCSNCEHCFMSANLRGKKYVFRNGQLDREEYEKKLSETDFGSYKNLEILKEEFGNLVKSSLHKFTQVTKVTNSSGDYLKNSKNARFAFDGYGLENTKFSLRTVDLKDSYDLTGAAWSEFLYEVVASGYGAYDLKFAILGDDVRGGTIIDSCTNSSDLFGCVSLRKKHYCILNKQYTKEEYEKLVPQIISHMNEMPYTDKKGKVYRYGEFFPPELSPFAYNEAVVQEYFPLTKEKALAEGYRWRDPDAKHYAITIQPQNLPDHIKDVGDSIFNETIGCLHEGKCNEQCTTAFKIVPQELEFYTRMNLPVPRLCPNCRHYARLAQRNPLKLWHRKCTCGGTRSENGSRTNTSSGHPDHGPDARCSNEFETSYAPDRPEIVYCEQCYNAEVA